MRLLRLILARRRAEKSMRLAAVALDLYRDAAAAWEAGDVRKGDRLARLSQRLGAKSDKLMESVSVSLERFGVTAP